MIDLTIKTLDSQNHKFNVPDNYTILELKEHIVDQVNVPVVQQRLIFCGRVLSNDTKLADIGIDGKVMHLVQKVPQLASTTSGSSSSTTTNTNSRSGPNAGPGFRGWHTHGHDPTVLFGAIGIPSELMHAGELPRIMSNVRNHGTGNRVALAIDMIRKSNEILNRLENPRTSGRPTTTDNEQIPEGSQQTDDTSGNVPPESSMPESSAQPATSDSDSVNVSYEVDETFPNTVVVTIDATHHMRMPPALMRQMQNRLQPNDSLPQNSNEGIGNNAATIPDPTTSAESTNQSSGGQASGTLPANTSATSERSSRNERHPSEARPSGALNDRRRLRELIDQLNKLNARLQPFHALYCQYINEDPQFESIEGNNGSRRAQTVYNSVSEVMHYLSHIYHAISDIRVSFNRSPPRAFQSRPCLLQGTILHTAHSVTTTTSSTPPPPPPPPPSTQQPTSTQTTNSSQSIPSVRAIRLDFLNPERVGNETPNVSTSATSTETNSNTTVDPNTENNTTSTEFPSDAPHGVELMFDLAPGSIRIDSVEAFVSPNAPGSSHPTIVSQPSSGNEMSNNLSMPTDWMDQMIDVISSGVRRPFMTEQSLDWSSIPTTSTRTPRVTPRTTNSSSTSNPPSQGLNHSHWDSSPRLDPFLPCSSHHFESHLRPMVLSRRSTQGPDRSTSSNSGNSTTDTSSPSSPNEMRPYSVRRSGRSRSRFVPEADAFVTGIHPILTWGRNHRINAATTSAISNAQGTSLPNTLPEHLRIGAVGNVFEQLETEIDLDRVRSNLDPDVYPTPESTYLARQLARQPDELLVTPIYNLPYFRAQEHRYITIDLFLMIARNWHLYDILHLNFTSPQSSIARNPITPNSERIVNFFVDRIMRNLPPVAQNIESAATRIFNELLPYLNVFQCSVPTRTNVDVNASFLRCIIQNLRTIVLYCLENRQDAINNIGSSLIMFAEGFLSLVVYCCNTSAIFRLSIGAIMQFFPLHPMLHDLVMDEIRLNIDRYWNYISQTPMLSLSVVDYIVPINSIEYDVGQTSQMTSVEQAINVQSNHTLLSSSENVDPLPEVVIGSQEWHHGVPSEWVPVITRDSQRQRRQGTQPPYSDAYLSGMPNKRRKIVTNSKPQGPLSQIIAKNLEVAMGAAGVTIKKEVTASIAADTEVQSVYTERIRSFGKSELDAHPDFIHDRYPNASKFFYDHPN